MAAPGSIARAAQDMPGVRPGSVRGNLAVAFYATTLLMAALLLFSVQPVTGRLLLPRLGGAPGVWAACLVFFQACLLVGYSYADTLARRVPKLGQALAHAVLLGTALALAPQGPPVLVLAAGGTSPVLELLVGLCRWLALPVVAVASTAPLIQHWFGQSNHRSARDPYYLYAASNLGSLLGLWGYPLLIEPLLTLEQQLTWWRRGLSLLIALQVGCVLPLLFGRSTRAAVAVPSGAVTLPSRLTSWSGVRWVGLAMIPSAMLQGITAYSTTDLAPIPLLWVVPLGLYLITYVLAFAQRPLVPHERVVAWVPAAVLALGFVLAAGLTRPLLVILPTHWAVFFLLCWATHGELAKRRPTVDHLTQFYLAVALGGVLGSCSVTLLAPALTHSHLEYPFSALLLILLLAWVAGPDRVSTAWRAVAEERAERRGERLVRTLRGPLAVGVLAAAAVCVARRFDAAWSPFLSGPLAMVACVLAYALKTRPRAFAVGTATLLLAPFLLPAEGQVRFADRTFFGVHRVVHDPKAARNIYVQGTTAHGLQSVDPGRARVAGAYYHATGPAGEVLRRSQPRRLGLVGLGVGSLAAYAERGQKLTFFEIDPVVARIAEDPRLFTFLRDARQRGAELKTVLGDGRLMLARMDPNSFDLLVVDAYTSDVVPTHLLTRQAFELYFDRLAPEGLLLLNISNRYLELGRVVGALASSGGYYALECLDTLDSAEEHMLAERDGKAVSRWVVLGRSERPVLRLELGPEWKRLASPDARAWTDDYANIVGAIAW